MSQIANETPRNPPFFGKNDWILDPAKIVQRSPINRSSDVPKEREQQVTNAITANAIVTIEKRVRFAPYIVVHSSIDGQNCERKMEPFELSRARSLRVGFMKLERENELLRDEAFILEHKNDSLTETIERQNGQIDRLKATVRALLLYSLFVIIMAAYYILRHSKLL